MYIYVQLYVNSDYYLERGYGYYGFVERNQPVAAVKFDMSLYVQLSVNSGYHSVHCYGHCVFAEISKPVATVKYSICQSMCHLCELRLLFRTRLWSLSFSTDKQARCNCQIRYVCRCAKVDCSIYYVVCGY